MYTTVLRNVKNGNVQKSVFMLSRGGNIVGEHDVIFAGRDEVITLSHHASSREVFAVGAVKAAKFLAEQPAGLYSMKEVLA